MSEYDEKIGVLIGSCGKLEQKLRNLRGATGKGIKELLETSYLDSETERKIRFAARIRNRCAHEDNKPTLEQINKAIKILNEVKIVKDESPQPVIDTPSESCHDSRDLDAFGDFLFRVGTSLLVLFCMVIVLVLAWSHLSTSTKSWVATLICIVVVMGVLGALWDNWPLVPFPKNAFTRTVVYAMYVLCCFLVFLFLRWLFT